MYPDREQLKTVLHSADNSINNLLLLNTEGAFNVFPSATAPSGYEYIVTIMSSVYNDLYVGPRASEDEELLNEYMKDANKAWEEYMGGKPPYTLGGFKSIIIK